MQRRAAAFLAAAMLAAGARAETFRVSNGNDDGAGSLRWAIQQSNATPGRDLISQNALLVIKPLSPLPPIDDAVTITYLSLDGTNAGPADGLVVRGNLSTFDQLHIANFNGSGMVIQGSGNSVFGSDISNNRLHGIWLTEQATGNTIGRPMLVVMCPAVPDGNAVMHNGGAGMLVSGTGNRLVNNYLGANKQAGATILAPTIFDSNGGGCNDGPFLDGTLLAAPVLTSATADATAATVAGVFRGEPSAMYTLDVLSDVASNGCVQGSLQPVDTKTIATDAAGIASFRVPFQPVASSITVLARNARGEVSRLSQRAAVVSTGENRSDLEIAMRGPATAATGQIVTCEVRVTNHGPAAMSGVSVEIPVAIGMVKTKPAGGGACTPASSGNACYSGLLASGESIAFEQTVRITASSGSVTLHAAVSQRDSARVVDPDASNNAADARIAVSIPRRRSTRH